MDWLRSLIDPEIFMPHGHCYLWRPGMVALQVSSNALIGGAYFAITFTLLYLVRKAVDIPFRLMYLAFGIFIIACGITHFFDVITVWTPVYWLDGIVRALTAVASVGTAVLLPPLVPKALELARAARSAHERGEELKIAHENLGTLYQRARRDAEEALRESASFMQVLGETIPQIVWTATADGARDYANRRWSEYTGVPTEDSLGDRWLERVHPDDVAATREKWARSVATLQPFEAEQRLRRFDGEWRWHLVRALPLLDREGKLRRWFGTGTDIQDQKKAIAELELSLRIRDEFLSVASHELRTPLTALQLNLESLGRRAPSDETAARRLRMSLRQTERLTRLIEQLLDVSRLGAEALELRKVPSDLAAIARRVVEDEGGDAQIVLEAASPATGRWDPDRVGLVVTNLVNNAIKYGRGKPVKLTVRATASQSILEVSDQGIGISAADRERIFERFERAASVRNYGGLGLGLWIARRIVDAHGGSLTVQSEEGRGTTFTLALPRG